MKQQNKLIGLPRGSYFSRALTLFLSFVIAACSLSGSITGGIGSAALTEVTPRTPIDMSFLSLTPGVPNNSTQPVVKLTGLAPGNIVTVYRDSACTVAVTSSVIALTDTLNVIINPPLPYGSYNFYAESKNLSGKSSGCSLSLLSDVIATVMKWTAGAKLANQFPVYGTLGIPSPLNSPGARNGFAYTKDQAGNFWLFGGSGYDSLGSAGALNDLWKFDGSMWTWVGGSNRASQTSVYGIKGVASSSNIISGRGFSTMWIDSHSNVWVFGGLDSFSRNDLWKFDGTNWTWIAGTNLTNQVGVYGTLGVSAPGNYPGTRYATASWIDMSDNLYVFAGQYWNSWLDNASDIWKFDGTNWVWIGGPNNSNQNGNYGTKGVAAASNSPGGRRYLISCTDASHRLWVLGGNGYGATGGLGKLNDLWRYDGSNWTWLSGSMLTAQAGVYGTLGVPDVANVPGGHSAGACVVDSKNNFWLIAGNAYDSAGTFATNNAIWKFDGTQWTWIRGSNLVNSPGIYKTKGLPDTTAMLSARGSLGAWIDSSDKIWIFGGSGIDSAGTSGSLSDLIEFDF